QLRSAPKTCLFLSINEASIADTQFLPWLRNLLKESGVDASHMVFQLREIDIGRNLGKAATLLTGLLQLGARTALTHFGLSINPMAMLKDRKSTRLNSSHVKTSYAVFCLKKKIT